MYVRPTDVTGILDTGVITKSEQWELVKLKSEQLELVKLTKTWSSSCGGKLSYSALKISKENKDKKKRNRYN